jgi:hypothetical protein
METGVRPPLFRASAAYTSAVLALLAVLDWSTLASLGTALGTLVLAVATFWSVRSSNRSARVAERALLVGLRPVLAPSRFDDPVQKIGFVDGKWLLAPGGGGAAEAADDAVYLAMAIRNVGAGMAVLHGWRFYPERLAGGSVDPAPVAEFRRLTRDLYIPAGDVGFWQGAFRDPAEQAFAPAREAVLRRQACTVDLLYGDHEGGQRAITRFGLLPHGDDRWLAVVSRHWNLDRPDPR